MVGGGCSVSVAVVIGVLWAAFWTYWLAAAFTAKSSVAIPRSPQALLFRVAVIGGVLVVARVPRLRTWLGGVTLGSGQALDVIGIALLVAGLAVAVWARVNLGRNWGTPMSEKADAELITTGPYRWVRHPIYTGIIAALVGSALALGPVLLLPVAVMAGYFVWSATVEERTMARLFPERYPAYRQGTRMLVPFVF